MTPSKVAFVLHALDNVATVIGGAVEPADVVMLRGVVEGSLIVTVGIPDGHKFALRDIAAGSEIFKYGSVVGLSTAAICKGEHVHIHNLESVRGRGDLGHERPETPRWRPAPQCRDAETRSGSAA